MRIFAGPNGSGKSTVIQAIRRHKINNKPIDFGIYINADDIAKDLLGDSFSFSSFDLEKTDRHDFIDMVRKSGLLTGEFPEDAFRESFSISNDNKLVLRNKTHYEYLAQILADYLRERLLIEGKKISFETVFSHKSKIDFMRRAAEMGYKIYLYFVATENPEINIHRIKKIRVVNGGHDVPEAKIRSRYERSLDNLYEAAQLTYQTYFFDNTFSDTKIESFAHFKVVDNQKVWDPINEKAVPYWFRKYYSAKIK